MPSEPITYAVRRNVSATDKRGSPIRIALCIIRYPNGDAATLAIPEGLLATIPPHRLDDYIAHEVESLIGYEVTRQ